MKPVWNWFGTNFLRALHLLLRLLDPLRNRTAEQVSAALSTASVRSLLIPGQMGIGNAIMFLPALRAIRHRYPQATLTVITNRGAQCAEVYRQSGLIDDIVERYDGRRFWDLIRETVFLLRSRYDLFLMRFNAYRLSAIAGVVLRRTPFRVGHVTSGRYQSGLDWLFNLPVPMEPMDHEVDRSLRLAQALRASDLEKYRCLEFETGPSHWTRVRELLMGAGADLESKPWIVIHPGCAPLQPYRSWSTDRWIDVVRELVGRGVECVVVGGAVEREIGRRIREQVRTGVYSLVDRLSLVETAALVKHSSCFVGIDSSVMHLAVCSRVPIVVLWGPADLTRTGPYRVDRKSTRVVTARDCHTGSRPCMSPSGELYGDCKGSDCMKAIRPADVVKAILEVLSL